MTGDSLAVAYIFYYHPVIDRLTPSGAVAFLELLDVVWFGGMGRYVSQPDAKSVWE
jgi:hypothetical protein